MAENTNNLSSFPRGMLTHTLLLFVFIAFAVTVGLQSLELSAGSFPGVLAIGLLVLTVWQGCLLARSKDAAAEITSVRPFIVLVLVSVLLLLIPYLGFYLASSLLVFSLTAFLGTRRPLTLILLPIAWCAFAYLVFGELLQVPLPESVLFSEV